MLSLYDRLKCSSESKAPKKIPETDAIFDNVHKLNAASDARSDSLRISMDTKAVLKLGELSRRGSSRGKEAVKAQDKDLDIKEKLASVWDPGSPQRRVHDRVRHLA